MVLIGCELIGCGVVTNRGVGQCAENKGKIRQRMKENLDMEGRVE